MRYVPISIAPAVAKEGVSAVLFCLSEERGGVRTDIRRSRNAAQ